MKTNLICVALLTIACVHLDGCASQGAATPPSPSQAAAPKAAPGITYPAHINAGGLVPGGNELKNPFAADANAAKNGAALFVAMNCDGCHGGDGAGWVGPSLADGRWRYGGADEEVFMSIYYGRPKGMPAFGGALAPEAIWTLVSYLKSLPAPANVPTESWDGP
jgi:mono/diheme cytochrome c family protein